MTHLDTELQMLRATTADMWGMVTGQLKLSKLAVEEFNKSLVPQIRATEKLIDAYELKIDMDCENILALFSPLANDLRFVLACLKINYNLERIGDFAWGIARLLDNTEKPYSKEDFERTGMSRLFETSIEMVEDSLQAFIEDRTDIARGIFSKDEILNTGFSEGVLIIADIIRNKPESLMSSLNLMQVLRKLERIGDHSKNVAEEIIFFLEAKMLKHKKKKTTI